MAYTVPNTIMDGVQEDLSSLVYKFVSTGQTNFQHFIELWKENHFCYIYSGRVNIKEVKYFAREILIMAKNYCCSKHIDAERIAGLFLMYALYHAQPLKIPVRIRIDKNELGDLLEFVKSGSAPKDAKLCFYRLFFDHAFDFVFSDKLYSIERIRDRDLELRNRKGLHRKGSLSTKEQLETLWKGIQFDPKDWMEKEREYNKLKTSLNSLGEGANFEMTEFLKPLLTLKEHEFAADKKPRVKSGDSKSSKMDKSKRIRSAFNVLEEAPSTSDEEPIGGTGSMPHLEDADRSDDDIDPLASDPND